METAESPLDELVRFVDEVTFEEIPAAAVDTIETAFVDTLGVTLAGSQTSIREKVSGALVGTGTRNPASSVPDEAPLSVSERAFLGATVGHSLDFDDCAASNPMHPSVTIVPALLAVNERMPVRGDDLVTAYLAGFEAQHYLATPISPSHQEHGWHTTGTVGPFAAAAAVAKLLGLDRERIWTTLNIAASMSSGIMANIGTDTKPMHAGQAARSGTTAALLAEKGFTAAPRAILGDGGFFDLYRNPSDDDPIEFPDLSPSPDGLGVLYDGIFVKKYPACGRVQSGIEAASQLRETTGLDSDEITAIEVVASQSAADVLPYERPNESIEAKFSMHFGIAVGLLEDDVHLETFNEDIIQRADVRALCESTDFQVDPTLPYSSYQTTCLVHTERGTYKETVRDPPGHPNNPMSAEEIREKFLLCASDVVNSDAEQLYEDVSTLSRQRETDFLRIAWQDNVTNAKSY
jgi:2-methylcitrate dehydratase PrpD